jgi:type III secretion system HrpE/YscL family protein
MSLKLMNAELLSRSNSKVVKRAAYEQVLVAQDLLASAKEAAAQQQRQLDVLRQEATRAGYAAGIEMGKQAWAQQLVEQQAKQQMQLKGMQQALVDVVMSSLRHLLGELPEQEKFQLLARQVLQSVVRARQVRLVVAATDAPAARVVPAQWQQRYPNVLAVDVVVDSALTAGDCLLETDEGAVDGRLNQRLSHIETALQQHLRAVSQPATAIHLQAGGHP